MPDLLQPDICVIGAGSGGLSVAAAAAAFGVEVVLIEKGKMGGDCLNYGCVPSKALLAAAKSAKAHGPDTKIGFDKAFEGVDFKSANRHVHDVIAAIAPHDSVERFEGLGVNVLQGAAKFSAPDCVRVGDTQIKARRFVVATGSSPAVPPIEGLPDVPFLTNETLFTLEEAPDALIIIGGGPIGMEMAQAHRRLGSRVTVVEAQKALGKDDPELAAIVLDNIRSEGVEVLEQTAVKSVANAGDGVEVQVETTAGPQVLRGSHVLVATGRRPNVEDLGLETAGVEFSPKGIAVDKGLRTSNRQIYAIGDVTGGLQFTHAAGYQAGLVIRSALFQLPVKYDQSILPWVTYTAPELGHVGMTEQDAQNRYPGRMRVLEADYSGNDRAVAEGKTTGRLKLIVGPGGRLLGADVVGDQAGEVVNLLSLAVSQNLKMKDLAGFVSPYPTLGEMVRRAAISYYAEAPKSPWVRTVVRILRHFG
ncbi:dihydrolipoyl dehydrogenase family protein [Roseibium sp.]|uniref:dihydrolipoyl dehydrogenase family protein n=1 Tax=Roseibium sp. TaxID=1936156 RepID=UPI003A97C891